MLEVYKNLLTTKGMELHAKSIKGEKIEITRFEIGNGSYTGTESDAVIAAMTSLRSVKKSYAVSKAEAVNSNTCKLTLMASNETITQGFYVTEIGVYAKGNNNVEVLYSIVVANPQKPDWMSAYNSMAPNVLTFLDYISVGNAANVTVAPGGGVFVLQTDFNKLEQRVIELEASKTKIFGARRKTAVSSSKWERLWDAKGMICQAAVGNEKVRNDMMNEAPFSEMRPCNLAADRTVNAYLGEPTFAWDGSNGDVMLEVPMCYTGRWFEVDENGVEWEYRAVSATPYPKLHLDRLFTDGAERRVSEKVYLPIFNGSLSTDGLSMESKAGAWPIHNKTRDQFRQLAKKKGTGWYLDDVWGMHILDTFFIVMFADSNAQAVLGAGLTELPMNSRDGMSLKARTGNYITVKNTYGNKFKIGMAIGISKTDAWGARLVIDRLVTKVQPSTEVSEAVDVYFDGEPAVIDLTHSIFACCQKTGSTIQMASPNGRASEDRMSAVRFLWIEDWYGNGWQFRDGDNIQKWQHYYCNMRSAYADRVYDGKYFKIGYMGAKSNGYVKKFGYDPEYPEVEICTDATGSSNTQFCDYYYQGEGGEIVLSGGLVDSGLIAGPFFRNCSNGGGIAIWYFLGRPQARK